MVDLLQGLLSDPNLGKAFALGRMHNELPVPMVVKLVVEVVLVLVVDFILRLLKFKNLLLSLVVPRLRQLAILRGLGPFFAPIVAHSHCDSIRFKVLVFDVCVVIGFLSDCILVTLGFGVVRGPLLELNFENFVDEPLQALSYPVELHVAADALQRPYSSFGQLRQPNAFDQLHRRQGFLFVLLARVHQYHRILRHFLKEIQK